MWILHLVWACVEFKKKHLMVKVSLHLPSDYYGCYSVYKPITQVPFNTTGHCDQSHDIDCRRVFWSALLFLSLHWRSTIIMQWLEWPMNQKCDIYEKTASKVFCSSAVKCTISKSNSNLLHIKFIVDFCTHMQYLYLLSTKPQSSGNNWNSFFPLD